MRKPLTQAVAALVSILVVAGIVYAGGIAESDDLGNLQPFSRVVLSVPGELEMIQGQGRSLRIDGPESARDALVIYVRNNTLHIESRRWGLGRNFDRLQFVVTVPAVTELVTSSAGNIHASRLESRTLSLVASSSGGIDVDRVSADTINARLSSSGRVTLSGSTNRLNLRISSSGEFRGRNLRVSDAEVQLSSSGSAHLGVSGDLSGSLSSGGDLTYYGEPTAIRVSTSSSGRVQRGN